MCYVKPLEGPHKYYIWVYTIKHVWKMNHVNVYRMPFHSRIAKKAEYVHQGHTK